MKSGFAFLLAIAGIGAFSPVRAQRPSRAAEPVTIGGENDLGASLSRPVAMRFVRNGAVVVVEEGAAPFITLVSASGVRKQAIGRSGAGPGEFRNVGAVAIDSIRNRLALFDPMLRRVSFYAIGDTLSFVESLPLPFHVSSACYLGSDLWVLGEAANDHIMHRLDERGGTLVLAASGGSMQIGHPLDGAPVFRSQVVQGAILCDSKSKRVIGTHHFMGVVQLLDAVSLSSTIMRLGGFRSLDYHAIGIGNKSGVGVRRDKSGTNDEIFALALRSGQLVLQVGRADREHKGYGDFAGVREYMPAAGAAVSAPAEPTQRKTVEMDAQGNRVLCYAVAPYPTLTIVTGSRCP